MSRRFILGLLAGFSVLFLFQRRLCFSDEVWEPVSAGPLTAWTAPLCGKGVFVAQPFFFYNRTRGTFDSDGHYASLPDGDRQYQYQEQLFLQYGVTDRLEVDAQTVYQHNHARRGGAKAHSRGLGDSYLFLRYCLFEEEGGLPHLTALFQVKAPTGKFQHADPAKIGTDLMGDGSWDPGFGVSLSKKAKPFLFHADATLSFPQKVSVDGVKTRYGGYLSYDLGLEYFLPMGFNLMLETNGFLQGDREDDGNEVPASDEKFLIAAAGVGWSCRKVQTLVVYQRAVLGVNTDAYDSVVLTCVYTF